MSKIRIDTQSARDIGRQIIISGEQLADIGRELQHRINGLDTWAWDGTSRSRAEPMLSEVYPTSKRIADMLDDMGRKLVRVAEVFETEDNNAAGELANLPWVDFSPNTEDAETPANVDSETDQNNRETKKIGETIERIWNDFMALLDVSLEKLPFLKDRIKEIADKIMDVLDHWNFWKAWNDYQKIDDKWLNDQASYDELLDAKNEFMKSIPGVGTAIGLMDILAVVVEQGAKVFGEQEIAQLAQEFQDHLAEIDFARAIDDHLDPPDVQ